MLLAEVFLPGLIIGAFGAISLTIAIALSYQAYGFQTGTLMLSVVVIVSLLGFMGGLNYFPQSFMGRKLTLTTSIKGPTDKPDYTNLLGKTGKALTHLRPAGTVSINGKRVDVVSEGEVIALDELIKVIQVEGTKVVVRKQPKTILSSYHEKDSA